MHAMPMFATSCDSECNCIIRIFPIGHLKGTTKSRQELGQRSGERLWFDFMSRTAIFFFFTYRAFFLKYILYD